MRYLLIIFLAVLSVGSLKAQEGNNTMYFLDNLPQRVRVNPSYQPEYNAWVGLPGLSGVQVNYMNTSFGVEDILKKKSFGRTDSVVIDLNSFHNALKKYNAIIFSNELPVLTVGFRVKSWYATLDIAEKSDFSFSFNKDLFTFLKEGNANYLGKTFDFGKLGINATAYIETALGLSKVINDRLIVGARLKVLFGIANVKMIDSELSVESVGDGEILRLHSKQDIRASIPLEPMPVGEFVDWDKLKFNDDDLSAGMVTGNLGFGVDLGGQYKLLDRLTLHASLVDLGFIRWSENTHAFTQDKTFDWTGADISNSVNENNPGHISMNDAFENLTDSIKDEFRLENNVGAYSTMLHTKFYAGATYQLCEMVNVGGLVKASIMNKHFYPSLAFSGNVRLLRNVSVAVTYSMMAGNYANIGAGLTAKLGPFQLYAVTDNTLAANYTVARNLNARVGINLLFGHQEKVERRRDRREMRRAERHQVSTEQVNF